MVGRCDFFKCDFTPSSALYMGVGAEEYEISTKKGGYCYVFARRNNAQDLALPRKAVFITEVISPAS